MNEHSSQSERPVLLGRVSQPKTIKLPRGGGPRVRIQSREDQVNLLENRFAQVLSEFGKNIDLFTALPASDPELVLVFEAIDERVDLEGIATRLGFEVLIETESAVEADDQFELISTNTRDPMIGSCLHAVCLNKASFLLLRNLWNEWVRRSELQVGYSNLRELFSHLKDVRPWSPQDRIRSIRWDEYFANVLDESLQSIEIELWYRGSLGLRQESERNLITLIEQDGGQVTSSAMLNQIGYHAVKCLVPSSMLMNLAQGHFDRVRTVRSASVLFLRVSGQSSLGVTRSVDQSKRPVYDLPQSYPVACIFDGVPATNHPLLAGRVSVLDPDDLASMSTAVERKHGTWMTSVVIWGDLSADNEPLSRPVLVRPILVPTSETINRVEEVPADSLTPDLMRRAFRDLFEGTDESQPAASEVVIVNLSVGDPAMLFDNMVSAWARMIDWLSYEYGVLVIVSAGNHSSLPLSPLDSIGLATLTQDGRRQAVLRAQRSDSFNRRLISPAEAINALTVGALHADESGPWPPGYLVDPADGFPTISPVSALGGGYRRSLKPELVAPGGRVAFRTPYKADQRIQFQGQFANGPGIRVASAGTNEETFISGTSPAAAHVTRQAARIYESLNQITDIGGWSRRKKAVAIKAMLIHGVRDPENFTDESMPFEQAFGNGVLIRDLSDGCSSNEATVLFLGSLGTAEEQEIVLPLPDGLNVRATKRIAATLAWLSPTNWKHRQYRRAALTLIKPDGPIPALGGSVDRSTDAVRRGAATVQHLIWETESAFAAGNDSAVSLRVKCFEQAGGLGEERIDFAVVLSLWVAPELSIDVYQQIKETIQARVLIQSRSNVL